MSEIKLLPCPFCGGDNLGFYHNHLFRDGYEVRCYDCHFGLQESRTKEEAIKQWNTRKPMERIADRLKEEIEVLEDFKEFNILHGEYRGCKKAFKIVKEEGMIND